MIGNNIDEPAAPVPDVTPSPDRNQFLRDVLAQLDAVADEVGARLEQRVPGPSPGGLELSLTFPRFSGKQRD
jgi:hypothetical protein